MLLRFTKPLTDAELRAIYVFREDRAAYAVRGALTAHRASWRQRKPSQNEATGSRSW